MTEGYFTNMTTASKNAAKELPISDDAGQVHEEASVPNQKAPKAASVTSIKKHEEPEFYGDDDNYTDGSSIVEKIKRLAKNKRVIAGAMTTTLLTGAVLIIRKRNSAIAEDEQNDETPTEA